MSDRSFELENLARWRCKQAMCIECRDRCMGVIRRSSGCPFCRSTMDKVVAIVNLHTFHEVKLVLNGEAKVFDISERSRRYFDRQCRNDRSLCFRCLRSKQFDRLITRSIVGSATTFGCATARCICETDDEVWELRIGIFFTPVEMFQICGEFCTSMLYFMILVVDYEHSVFREGVSSVPGSDVTGVHTVLKSNRTGVRA